MKALKIFVVSVGCAFMGSTLHGDDLHTNGRSFVIEALFKKVDLSSLDRNIDSVLDKQHVSRQELELLKAQALLEAVESVSPYNAPVSEKLISEFQSKGALVVKAKEQRKTFDERLKELTIDDRLKDELKSFAQYLKIAVENAGQAFQNFQETPEVKRMEKEASTAGEGLTKKAEEFTQSTEFKRLQDATADIFKKWNQALEDFFKEKSTPEKGESSPKK